MFPRAQLNMLHLLLTFFTALRLVSSRSVAVSPNNEAKNTEGQVGSKTKQLLRQQNNDVIAAHVRPPASSSSEEVGSYVTSLQFLLCQQYVHRRECMGENKDVARTKQNEGQGCFVSK